MADGERKLLFDLRGGRRHVVRFVYAVLALLMAASLLLVVGPFNVGELVGGGSTKSAGELQTERAEQIQRHLAKEPKNEQLLLALTRARHNAGNSLYEVAGPEEEPRITGNAWEQLHLARSAWNKYLKATDEPSLGLAQLMAPTLLVLAEYVTSVPEATENLEAAVEAQQLVADGRPSLNSLSTLAFYTAILGKKTEAERVAKEATKYTNTKAEKENIQTQLESYEKSGNKFRKALQKAEAASNKEGKKKGKERVESIFGGAVPSSP
jgi:hypothetical protein